MDIPIMGNTIVKGVSQLVIHRGRRSSGSIQYYLLAMWVQTPAGALLFRKKQR
jgi:hypothetical protein